MTGVTCGAGNVHSFPEHLISLSIFVIYTLYITEFVSFRTMFTY